MSFMKRVKKFQVVALDPKLEKSVASMLADPNLIRALPDLIDAANAAIKIGGSQKKPDMVKFNQLSLSFFQAMKKNDLKSALDAAEKIVKSGHGKAFGL